MNAWPQVPAEQRTQRLWCGECFVSDTIGIDEVAEELGWSEGRCPDCGHIQDVEELAAALLHASGQLEPECSDYQPTNRERSTTVTQHKEWAPPPEFAAIANKVLRRRRSTWTISDLRACRKGRSMDAHRDIVSICAEIARKLAEDGKSHGYIAEMLHRENSTVSAWLRGCVRAAEVVV